MDKKKREANLKRYFRKLEKEGYNVYPEGNYTQFRPILNSWPKRKKKYKSAEKKRFIGFKFAFKYNREPEKILRWLFLGLKFAEEKSEMSLEDVLFILHLEGLGTFKLKDVSYYPFSKRPKAETRIRKYIDKGLVEKFFHDPHKNQGLYYRLTQKAYAITNKVYEVLSEEQILRPSPISTPKIFLSKEKGGKWRESFLKYNEEMSEDLGFF